MYSEISLVGPCCILMSATSVFSCLVSGLNFLKKALCNVGQLAKVLGTCERYQSYTCPSNVVENHTNLFNQGFNKQTTIRELLNTEPTTVEEAQEAARHVGRIERENNRMNLA